MPQIEEELHLLGGVPSVAQISRAVDNNLVMNRKEGDTTGELAEINPFQQLSVSEENKDASINNEVDLDNDQPYHIENGDLSEQI